MEISHEGCFIIMIFASNNSVIDWLFLRLSDLSNN